MNVGRTFIADNRLAARGLGAPEVPVAVRRWGVIQLPRATYRRNSLRSSRSGRVLMTSFAVSQARRA
jgi:hypothetical protein